MYSALISFSGANATLPELQTTAWKPDDVTYSGQYSDGGGAGTLNLACWGEKGPGGRST